ncbi:MAG: 4-hydroxy-3-methylbut-2-enyl diphosphate reductase [Candidatus Glassbacteria bacterium RIFCSPLOWO2_12_FULL_58_11]|uniref:4-hydroxy-3-methylbut-2-enyl diphosphate reductase n=1 Tax=Candidatus Glassbacteria bacterium RIFCSPLOWO2_12_FULL_58_11 TaxID=1817867 RepID=A0A1F5YWC2_9BACT|nr:MAG: 4-hydroxy-3-methylbut-2-enyl diphosphate reductase [Candidatus Glassbacteria bacterium RIFCSPLOWO2_12_FULL_58_11]
MKVILAQSAGFCKGVRRAMAKVLEQSGQAERPVYTDGPLIHNPQTIDILSRRGVKMLSEQDQPASGDTVFIRTHGVTPERRQEIMELGVQVCDATCPDVAKIQGLIRMHRRSGYLVVIVGDKNHAEVIGLAGYAGESGRVVGRAEEVSGLQDAEKICVVAQSTLDRSVYDQVAEAVKARFREVKVLDTICPSTYRRQDELRELSRSVDAVVVVGGKNSANTRHLVEISQGCGTPTFHVETAVEIDEMQLKSFHTVAVTAGASTPNWILMQVVDRLKMIDPQGTPAVFRWLKMIGRFVITSNLYIAVGAALLCHANSRLIGISLDWISYSIAFFYILSAHLTSRFTAEGLLELKKSRRGLVFDMEAKFFVWLAGFSASAALILAGLEGPVPFSIMLALIALGLLYRIDIPQLRLPFLGKKSVLHLIPASKDLFMGLGWSFVTVIFPCLLENYSFSSPALYLTFVSTFLLVIIRSLFFDIRDIQGDLILGRETLPTIIGTRGTKVLVLSLTIAYGLLMSAGSAFGWLSGLGYLMLALSAYICLYILLYHKKIIRREIPVEVTGDTQFILAGVLALLHG